MDFKIFLITTIHNRDSRWQYIRQHLYENGIEYTPILAPDFSFIPEETVKRAKHISLTLAYYQIAQTAMFEGLLNYMVIEDDINLSQDGHSDILEAIRFTPEDFDLCYLTKVQQNHDAQTRPYNEHLDRIIGNWWETPATLWSLKFAEAFCKEIASKQVLGSIGNIDHELLKMNDTGKYNFFGAKKNTANGLSTIREKAEGLNITFETAIG